VGLIIETIVTTTNPDGSVNIAPMGPRIDVEQFEQFELRPFEESQTLRNLIRTGQGVLHITDDATLFVQSALRSWDPRPATEPATAVSGHVLVDCCRWYEFEIQSHLPTEPRHTLIGRSVHSGRRRDFLGFNRARHALIEAAILATRIDFLPFDEIERTVSQLASRIEKTGGTKEQQALQQVIDFVHQHRHADPTGRPK